MTEWHEMAAKSGKTLRARDTRIHQDGTSSPHRCRYLKTARLSPVPCESNADLDKHGRSTDGQKGR
jgi:hypothetical protein